MDEYRVKLSNIRIAPRKVRLVADLIRNTDVDEATYQLQYSTKRASDPMLKLMNSAVANAKVQDSSLDTDSLFIKEIRVDEGVTLKRLRPVSRGRAHPIAKKTSHITLVLGVASSPDSSQEKPSDTSKPTNTNKGQDSTAPLDAGDKEQDNASSGVNATEKEAQNNKDNAGKKRQSQKASTKTDKKKKEEDKGTPRKEQKKETPPQAASS
ncbi:MAG: 50S ribosomal protein L22 [Candidatus Spechtbacteria bacterium SB0662_bin_43]|uniref:Large ribosomal subunit protein uL22 n=1 Tax=Candidatus Spechtbacteria bacterium SB0662_bin_43 TaxID=2604897 RepID=A0A845DAW6_9BACT|nr:50S ribosomal protein L22 [Candidatus Spechtbacteria bacterium SB0662_bin_43]